jgi:hypothetical protein
MRIKMHSFVLTLALVPLLTSIAYACSCTGEELPCQAYWDTPAVFVGRVISFAPSYEEERRTFNFELKQGSRVYRFAVEQAFRGVEGTEVEVRTSIGGGSCGYYFSLGKRYLVYAGFDPKTGMYGTSICTRTRPLENAHDDLAYIFGQSDKKAKNGISGTVIMEAVNLTGRSYLKELGPAAGLEVAAQTGKRLFKTTTNADGRYEFRNLPPGQYRVYLWDEVNQEIWKQGIVWGTRYELGLSAGPKFNCTGADFSVRPKARVSGKVFDHEGRPLREARVSATLAAGAYKDDDRVSFKSEISDYTEQDGSYVLDGLPPGRYLVGVNIDHTPEGRRPFAPTYYPGVREKSAAAVVIISEKEKLEGYDLHLSLPLPEHGITVRVLMPDGRPAKGARVLLEDSEFYGTYPGYPVSTNGEGVATLNGFGERKYWLHAAVGNYGDEASMHAEPVELAPSTITEAVTLVVNSSGYQCTHYKGSKGGEKP